jgi:hypothetical protein
VRGAPSQHVISLGRAGFFGLSFAWKSNGKLISGPEDGSDIRHRISRYYIIDLCEDWYIQIVIISSIKLTFQTFSSPLRAYSAES